QVRGGEESVRQHPVGRQGCERGFRSVLERRRRKIWWPVRAAFHRTPVRQEGRNDNRPTALTIAAPGRGRRRRAPRRDGPAAAPVEPHSATQAPVRPGQRL